MNNDYIFETKSKLLCFMTVFVLCVAHASGNLADNQRFGDTLSYKYDTFDPFKISDNSFHMLDSIKNEQHNRTYNHESLSLNTLLINFIDKSLNLTYYELAPGIFVLKNNDTIKSSNHGRNSNGKLNILHHLIKFAESHVISVPLSLPESTGRLFFFKGSIVFNIINKKD